MTIETYTDEQIRAIANEMACVQSFDPWSARAISNAHLALRSWLSEREQATQGVTDEIVDRACRAAFTESSQAWDFCPDDSKKFWRKWMRAALEAVWPVENSDD